MKTYLKITKRKPDITHTQVKVCFYFNFITEWRTKEPNHLRVHECKANCKNLQCNCFCTDVHRDLPVESGGT